MSLHLTTGLDITLARPAHLMELTMIKQVIKEIIRSIILNSILSIFGKNIEFGCKNKNMIITSNLATYQMNENSLKPHEQK